MGNSNAWDFCPDSSPLSRIIWDHSVILIPYFKGKVILKYNITYSKWISHISKSDKKIHSWNSVAKMEPPWAERPRNKGLRTNIPIEKSFLSIRNVVSNSPDFLKLEAFSSWLFWNTKITIRDDRNDPKITWWNWQNYSTWLYPTILDGHIRPRKGN